jgi:hypothetical protein
MLNANTCPPRVQKLNLKGTVLNGVLLTDELVQTVVGDPPVSMRIGVTRKRTGFRWIRP